MSVGDRLASEWVGGPQHYAIARLQRGAPPNNTDIDMTDDELMAVMVKVDPLTRRIPAGIRAIAQAIESLVRAQALEDAAKVCDGLHKTRFEDPRETTAELCAIVIRALPPHG